VSGREAARSGEWAQCFLLSESDDLCLKL